MCRRTHTCFCVPPWALLHFWNKNVKLGTVKAQNYTSFRNNVLALKNTTNNGRMCLTYACLFCKKSVCDRLHPWWYPYGSDKFVTEYVTRLSLKAIFQSSRVPDILHKYYLLMYANMHIIWRQQFSVLSGHYLTKVTPWYNKVGKLGDLLWYVGVSLKGNTMYTAQEKASNVQLLVRNDLFVAKVVCDLLLCHTGYQHRF